MSTLTICCIINVLTSFCLAVLCAEVSRLRHYCEYTEEMLKQVSSAHNKLACDIFMLSGLRQYGVELGQAEGSPNEFIVEQMGGEGMYRVSTKESNIDENNPEDCRNLVELLKSTQEMFQQEDEKQSEPVKPTPKRRSRKKTNTNV